MTELPNDIPRLRHVGFVQLQVTQGEIDTNLTRLKQMLAQLDPPRETLVVLPELWATGFAYRELPKLQDEMTALTDRLQELAESYEILLAGSLPERTSVRDNQFFNTLSIIGGKGAFGKYRKRHIFPGEEQAFCPSDEVSPPVATPAGVFGCLVCYDLRFPELARRQCQQGADLLLCSAEWPSARIYHWRTLVIARAIENQTFIVACNGVGKNGEATLGGHSLVVSPAGEVLYEAGDDEEAKIVTIDWQVKKNAQAGFRSFTAEPYRVSTQKVATPESCVADAEQRARIGQRVVYVRLDQEAFSQAIEILEAVRQQGDYLVAGVRLPEKTASRGQAQRRDLLKPYAALGCVDAVFDLGEIAPSAEKRLQEICRD